MKTIKRILSLALAGCLIFTVAACKNSKTEESNVEDEIAIGSGYTESTESDYNSIISKWAGAENSDGFDNTTGTDVLTPKPGTVGDKSTEDTNTTAALDKLRSEIQNDTAVTLSSGGNTPKLINLTASAEESSDNQSINPDDYSFFKHDLPESALSNKEDLQYFYEGANYAYGITNNGAEYIAFIDEYGNMYDVVNGAGQVVITNIADIEILSCGAVKDFKRSMQGSYFCITVEYTLIGTAKKDSTVKATYTFKENCISYSVQISVNSSTAIEGGFLRRNFPNSYIEDDVRVMEKWIYPENGDYMYPEFESAVFRNQIDESLYMYSYLRGSEVPTLWNQPEKMSAKNIPLSIESGNTGMLHTETYDLVLYDIREDGADSDYKAMFLGNNSDFAAGIAPVTANKDNSTIFEGNSCKLNINVTNLTDDDLKFSLRYNIYNYYGEMVDSGIFLDSMVYAEGDANRTVTVGGDNVEKPYGMYYLNLYVMTKYATYMECYPFALVEDYDFNYNDTSPFGIASASCGENQNRWIDTAHLFGKVGVANARIGATENQIAMVDVLKSEYGITHFNGGLGHQGNTTQQGVESWQKMMREGLSTLGKYVDAIECGNELSLFTLQVGGPTIEELFPKFYFYTHLPTMEVFKDFPNITYIPTPCSACETGWLSRFKGFEHDIDGDGITNYVDDFWDDVTTFSAHIYGHPQMPDQYSNYVPEYGGNLWCIEGGMQRIKKFLSENLDKNGKEKRFYMTEIGYPTAPNAKSIAIMIQADYISRSGIICTGYGCDRVQFYQMYDRTSYNAGYSNADGEWNFGLCYKHDYYGIIKPKPGIIGFSTMARCLESMVPDSGTVCEKYDEGWNYGGVRAFSFETELHGDVVAVWSNAQVLSDGRKDSNGALGDRVPTYPWNTLWTETDETVFEATGDTVRVVDVMGNSTEYKAVNGKVTIPLTGSTFYIFGVKVD